MIALVYIDGTRDTSVDIDKLDRIHRYSRQNNYRLIVGLDTNAHSDGFLQCVMMRLKRGMTICKISWIVRC